MSRKTLRIHITIYWINEIHKKVNVIFSKRGSEKRIKNKKNR